MQKAVSSILLLISLLFSVATPALADDSHNINLDCGFFGIEGTGFNNAQNFSLAAFEGGSIANATAIPLELNPRFNTLTATEFVGIAPTVFSLADGTLYSNGTGTLLHIAKHVQNGTEVTFSPTFTYTSISQLCAVASTDPESGSPDPTLAAFGNTDAFSICKTTTIPPTSAIIYNATAHSKNYEFKTCVEVQVRLIFPQ
ncbi:hypothetical protein Clacol_004628 [Clathrus columnatus]|uniref:Uncharacterized protein n=1 Tax=Clathrus columnatus TaxID=1419009 RepID=A0AAV5A9L6_9AGAM|nr:hypothetical protein Clacol_004628 [Clathrus columnatus]